MLETKDDESVWDDFQVKGDCVLLPSVKRALLDLDVETLSFRRFRPDMATADATSLYDVSEEISIPVEESVVQLPQGDCMVRKLSFDDWEVVSPALKLGSE